MRVVKVMETIVENRDPDWNDLQVILNAMTYGEKKIVMPKTKEETDIQATQAG